MQSVVEKAKSTGNENILVCERGFSFGYNNLVSDMRSLVIMRETNCPVVFDALIPHSFQDRIEIVRVGKVSTLLHYQGQQFLLEYQVFLWKHTPIQKRLYVMG